MQHLFLVLGQNNRWKTAALLLGVSLQAHALMALPQEGSRPATELVAMNSGENHAGGNVPAGTVGTSAPHRSIKQLTQELKNQDPSVRAEAVEALGDARDPGAVKPLISELHDQDPYVRAIADTALIRMGPTAVQALIVALKESDPYVPALAALALSTMKDSSSHDALMKALQEHNSRAIFGIHTYYVKLGVPGSEAALIEALDKYPSREMAEEFLSSGNPALQQAAKAWAIRFNRTLRTTSAAAAVRWGSAEDMAQQPAAGAQ